MGACVASPHVDTFVRDNLPPPREWPTLQFDLAELRYPEQLNAAVVLLDDALLEGHGEAAAILQGERRLTYREFAQLTDAMAWALAEDLGVRPGERVLLRAANSPEMFAAWLAVLKIGAIAVPTMPLLRRRELAYILAKTRPRLALCDAGLLDELRGAADEVDPAIRLLRLCGPDMQAAVSSTPALRLRDRGGFSAVKTRADDICLIAFTSGTTGEPKAALHVHRDILAMCDTVGRHIIRPAPGAIFSGTPPIAFTFGLGALLVFPLRFRGSSALPTGSGPEALAEAVQRHSATHLFTSPTGYRAILARRGEFDLASLEVCVSAGEHLPAETWRAWFEATGIRMIDGIGATEMIHIFVSTTPEAARPGCVGKAVPGYQAELMDGEGRLLEGEATGRLAVRGPTGCRYMSDARQTAYVVNGWNVTGDVFRRDADGYLSYVARSDDMIISSGYNISGPEVEAVLIQHPQVADCAVIGEPDERRGQLVKAVVVPVQGVTPDADFTRALQDYVKANLAAYKYPRIVEYRDALPRTPNGKLQRQALREASSSA